MIHFYPPFTFGFLVVQLRHLKIFIFFLKGNMRYFKFGFYLLFFCHPLFSEGFLPETYIWTASGPVRIGEVGDNDLVIGFKKNAYLCCTKIAYKGTSTVLQLVEITVGEQPDCEKIFVAPDQQFCRLDGSWVNACNLNVGDVVRGCTDYVEIKEVMMIPVDAGAVVCTIGMDDEFGCFYISRHGILAYNGTSQKFWKPAKRVAQRAVEEVATNAIGTVAGEFIFAALKAIYFPIICF